MVAWDQIFDLALGNTKSKAKLKAVREIVRAKYVFACEQAFKWRYADPATLAEIEAKEEISSKTSEVSLTRI
jgi:hypothetical protein